MTARRIYRRGFTLLEMLAATAMAAMLIGSMYASLRIAFRARRSALTAVDTVRRTTLAMDIIQADLQSAVLPGDHLTGQFLGEKTGALNVGTDELSFCIATTDRIPESGVGNVKFIEYLCQIDDATGTNTLVRGVTGNLLSPVEIKPQVEVVCRNVLTFSCRYFDGTAWQDQWDSTTQNNALPVAVEITLEIPTDIEGETYRITRNVLVPTGQGTVEAAEEEGAA